MDSPLHRLFLEHEENDVDVSLIPNDLDDISLDGRMELANEIFPSKNTPAFLEERESIISIAYKGYFSNLSTSLSHEVNSGTLDVMLDILEDKPEEQQVWILMRYMVDMYNFNLEKVLCSLDRFLKPPYLGTQEMWRTRVHIVKKLRSAVHIVKKLRSAVKLKMKEFKLAKQYLSKYPTYCGIWHYLRDIAVMLGEQVMLDELKFSRDVIELEPQNSMAWGLRIDMILGLKIHTQRLVEAEIILLNQMMPKDPQNKYAWRYRRLLGSRLDYVINKKLKRRNTKCSDIICMKDFYAGELKFVDGILLKFVDNGNAWEYKSWVVCIDSQGVCNIEAELDFVYRVLLKDEKCTHAWSWRRFIFKKMLEGKPTLCEFDFANHFLIGNGGKNECAWHYRQWLLSKLGKWEEEIDFCNGLLLKDASNACAWTQKMFVLQKIGTEKRKKEVKYAIGCIHRQPESGHPWMYLKELYQKRESGSDFDDAIDDILETVLSIKTEYLTNEAIINALDTVLGVVRKGYKVNQRIGGLIRVLCCRLLWCDEEDGDDAGSLWDSISSISQCLDPLNNDYWKWSVGTAQRKHDG